MNTLTPPFVPAYLSPINHADFLDLQNLWRQRQHKLATEKYRPYVEMWLTSILSCNAKQLTLDRMKAVIAHATDPKDIYLPINTFYSAIYLENEEGVSYENQPYTSPHGKTYATTAEYVKQHNLDSRVTLDTAQDLPNNRKIWLWHNTDFQKRLATAFDFNFFGVRLNRTTAISDQHLLITKYEIILEYFPGGTPLYRRMAALRAAGEL